MIVDIEIKGRTAKTFVAKKQPNGKLHYHIQSIEEVIAGQFGQGQFEVTISARPTRGIRAFTPKRNK